MEVVPPPMDLDLATGRFGQCFLSAPASPTFHSQYDDLSIAMEKVHNRGANCSVSDFPFDWEQKPDDPVISAGDELEFDFSFDVSNVSEMASISTEELFSGGKIRSLKPQLAELEEMDEKPKSPIASPIVQGKNFLRDMFSLKRKKQREAEKKSVIKNEEQSIDRSISWNKVANKLTSSSSGSSKRWNLKDLILFRSASEGRGSDKDHLRKYAAKPMFVKNEDVNNGRFGSAWDVRNTSFRSAEGLGSRRRISAHEMHYAANKTASENLKKKTFLPYNQGILAFNPSVHVLATFGSLGR